MLSIIVAMAENSRVIGLKGDLPWKLSADLRRFKRITSGHTVVMGRKTWESIPPKFRPLPNRKNIVLTRQPSYGASVPDDVGVARSLDYAIEMHVESSGDRQELFVIGGESVYRGALSVADRIYLTLVKYEDDGDTFFPADPWEGFERDPGFEEAAVGANEKNSHESSFLVLRRKTT